MSDEMRSSIRYERSEFREPVDAVVSDSAIETDHPVGIYRVKYDGKYLAAMRIAGQKFWDLAGYDCDDITTEDLSEITFLGPLNPAETK